MPQLSLFPDGFELQEQALRALRELDTARASALLERARSVAAGLGNLAAIGKAIAWLELRVGPEPDAALCAALLRELGPAVLAGELPGAAAEFAEQALARFIVRRGMAQTGYVDASETVPAALVALVLGDAASAHAALRDLLSQGRGDRPELWGWFGDAAVLVGRGDEAKAAWVRALVLSAGRADLWRCRLAGLQAALAQLRRRLPLDAAREVLLAEAWLQGALAIPAGNRWLEPARVRELVAGAPAGAGDAAVLRFRRFSRLLYVDRSAGPGAVDLRRREEMQALTPEHFARYVRLGGAASR